MEDKETKLAALPSKEGMKKSLPLTRKQFKRLIYLQKRNVIQHYELQKRKEKNRVRNKMARKSRRLNRVLKYGH